MVNMFYTACRGRFVVKDQKTKKNKEKGPSRRQRETGTMQKELRFQWKAFKAAQLD